LATGRKCGYSEGGREGRLVDLRKGGHKFLPLERTKKIWGIGIMGGKGGRCQVS